jgi:hypothetical protein
MLGEAFAATAAAVERLQGEMQHGIADQGDTIAQISKEIEYLRALPTPECGPAAPARCGTPGASTFASAASASFVARISKAEATLKWGYCGQSDPSFDDEPGELAVGVGTCASMLHARAEPLARTFGARFRDLHWYSEDTLDSQLIRNVTRIRPFEGEERKSEFGGAWLSLPILHHLFLESPAAKWYLILDDDTFLIPENLLCQVRLLARCFALRQSQGGPNHVNANVRQLRNYDPNEYVYLGLDLNHEFTADFRPGHITPDQHSSFAFGEAFTAPVHDINDAAITTYLSVI